MAQRLTPSKVTNLDNFVHLLGLFHESNIHRLRKVLRAMAESMLDSMESTKFEGLSSQGKKQAAEAFKHEKLRTVHDFLTAL